MPKLRVCLSSNNIEYSIRHVREKYQMNCVQWCIESTLDCANLIKRSLNNKSTDRWMGGGGGVSAFMDYSPK